MVGSCESGVGKRSGKMAQWAGLLHTEVITEFNPQTLQSGRRTSILTM